MMDTTRWHSMDFPALTPDMPEEQWRGVQYIVRLPSGDVAALNGDQHWVRDGGLRAHLGAGVTVVRDVRVMYGEWRPADRHDLRVHVFYVRGNPYIGTGWTWCWERRGNAEDAAWNLPKACRGWRPVFDAAMTALKAAQGMGVSS